MRFACHWRRREGDVTGEATSRGEERRKNFFLLSFRHNQRDRAEGCFQSNGSCNHLWPHTLCWSNNVGRECAAADRACVRASALPKIQAWLLPLLACSKLFSLWSIVLLPCNHLTAFDALSLRRWSDSLKCQTSFVDMTKGERWEGGWVVRWLGCWVVEVSCKK